MFCGNIFPGRRDKMDLVLLPLPSGLPPCYQRDGNEKEVPWYWWGCLGRRNIGVVSNTVYMQEGLPRETASSSIIPKPDVTQKEDL